MATSMHQPYDRWLADKLLALNPEVDTDVFVMYISSILEEDSPLEEKKESILDLLAEVLETDRELACNEIVKKYEEIHNKTMTQDEDSVQKNIADQLSNMLEKQTIEPVKAKGSASDEAKARKAAILAQYSNVSDEEDETGPSSQSGASGGGGPSGGSSGGISADPLLMKNTNAESVAAIEKEKRDKAKEESDKKKEKDKQDRALQKQKAADRKDAEKKRTQKGERRR